MAILNENIRKARLSANKTLEEVANIVGVSKQTIQKYESGVISNIPSDKIELLAKALNTTPVRLMGWENDTDIDEDVDIRRIARAHKQMTDEDRKRFMKIITVAFDEYFPDDTENE